MGQFGSPNDAIFEQNRERKNEDTKKRKKGEKRIPGKFTTAGLPDPFLDMTPTVAYNNITLVMQSINAIDLARLGTAEQCGGLLDMSCMRSCTTLRG